MSTRPTILLLPGNMCDERMWDGVMPALAGWKVEHHLPIEPSLPEMARECLSKYAGKLIPIGFSMGAILGLAIADIAPERIAALGVLDGNAGPDRPDRAAARPRQQRDVLAHGVDQLVAEELKPAYFAEKNQSDQMLRDLVLEMAIDLGPEFFVAQSEALRTRPDYSPVLAKIDVPILFACGDEDKLCPPALHREMANMSRNPDLHIVTQAGHMLPMEQPEKLRNILTAWLARIDKETPCLIES